MTEDRQPVIKKIVYKLTCPLCKTEIELHSFQWQVKCPKCSTVHDCYLKNS